MANLLRNTLEQFPGKNVIVWGDIILDEYIYTSTTRISREAPVLVTEFESNDFKLGGAGNVVMNIKSLGANPVPVCFIGSDADSNVLKNILSENQIQTDFLIDLEHYRTPKKSRILSGAENTKKQQVLRIDTVNKQAIPKAGYNEIENSLLELLETFDLLVVSDYLYQTAQPAILNSIRNRFPLKLIVVDSRNHLLNFKNISLATPNEPELKKIFPGISFNEENDYIQAGTDLMKRMDASSILLKRGSKGMMTFEKNVQAQSINIYGVKDIVDGTGAGDTVIAVTSLASLAGADLITSAKLASMAAGMVVMKEGAYPIGYQEFLDALA
jgi:rfaE bifunctional protein kinase chain/domain